MSHIENPPPAKTPDHRIAFHLRKMQILIKGEEDPLKRLKKISGYLQNLDCEFPIDVSQLARAGFSLLPLAADYEQSGQFILDHPDLEPNQARATFFEQLQQRKKAELQAQIKGLKGKTE